MRDAAERRSHHAVAEADHQHEQPRDRLLDRREQHTEHHRRDAARAARVERDVVKVPRGGLDHAEEEHRRDARLQRQQLRAVAQAQHEPHDAERDVRERQRAEERKERVELARQVAVRVEPRRVPRDEHAARLQVAAREQQVVHAAPHDRHSRLQARAALVDVKRQVVLPHAAGAAGRRANDDAPNLLAAGDAALVQLGCAAKGRRRPGAGPGHADRRQVCRVEDEHLDEPGAHGVGAADVQVDGDRRRATAGAAAGRRVLLGPHADSAVLDHVRVEHPLVVLVHVALDEAREVAHEGEPHHREARRRRAMPGGPPHATLRTRQRGAAQFPNSRQLRWFATYGCAAGLRSISITISKLAVHWI